MNKRARNRLVGVTAIILITVAAIFFSTAGKPGGMSYSATVSQALSDETMVGKRIKVTGAVVPGSWDKVATPLIFEIRDPGKTTGDTLKITYRKGAPSSFGDDAEAIVTGVLKADRTIEAEDLLTKCPSTYRSKRGAETVESLFRKGDEVVGKFLHVQGYVKAGSMKGASETPRFVVTGSKSGGRELPVAYEKAIPDDVKDGVQVVVEGTLDKDGLFSGTKISIAK